MPSRLSITRTQNGTITPTTHVPRTPAPAHNRSSRPTTSYSPLLGLLRCERGSGRFSSTVTPPAAEGRREQTRQGKERNRTHTHTHTTHPSTGSEGDPAPPRRNRQGGTRRSACAWREYIWCDWTPDSPLSPAWSSPGSAAQTHTCYRPTPRSSYVQKTHFLTSETVRPHRSLRSRV